MGGQTCSMSGMIKRYIVNLTRAEREALEGIVKRERVSGVKRQRASILLKADDDLTDQEIAEEVEVGVRTVARVRQRCIDRGVVASLERKAQENPSRPRKLDGAAEARLAQLACSDAPEGRSRWTLSLLADKLVELKVFESVSTSTIQRGLKKTRSSLG
jgi:transposase